MKGKSKNKKEDAEKEMPRVVADVQRLVKFIRENGPISHAQIGFKFGWSDTKTYGLLRMALDNFEDIYKDPEKKYNSRGNKPGEKVA